ncbi:MAG: tyrosinase family protein [Actinobacteria bacterium]|nr:tyrosinase family protein [Actinomycetota bacterium]
MAHKLHPSRHRKSINDLSADQRLRLRQLLDTYIATQNPVAEHLAAANNMSLHIHGHGFLVWHTVFIAKLEQWLALNGGGQFVPLPSWDPDTDIPAELSRGNHQPNPPIPFPDELRPGPIVDIPSYEALNEIVVPYHNDVHDNMGGQMPFPLSSPSDPIFYPFHAFLLAVYEHWRNH